MFMLIDIQNVNRSYECFALGVSKLKMFRKIYCGTLRNLFRKS